MIAAPQSSAEDEQSVQSASSSRNSRAGRSDWTGNQSQHQTHYQQAFSGLKERIEELPTFNLGNCVHDHKASSDAWRRGDRCRPPIDCIEEQTVSITPCRYLFVFCTIISSFICHRGGWHIVRNFADERGLFSAGCLAERGESEKFEFVVEIAIADDHIQEIRNQKPSTSKETWL